MGQIEVNQILRHLTDEYKDVLPDLLSTNENAKGSALSKALAMYSINLIYLNVSKNEVFNCLVDGGDDNGIDLIYYDEEQSELCLVQSKCNKRGNSEPQLQEVKTFLSGIRDLIELKFHKFNDKIKSQEKYLTDILMESSIRIRAVLIHTAVGLSEHSMREFKEFKDEQNTVNEIFDFSNISQKRLYGSLAMEKQEISHSFPLLNWGKTISEPIAYYGTLSTSVLAELWSLYDTTLFSENLRKGLGKTDINIEMTKTLEVEPQNFWYFNNGVTLVCDTIKKKAAYGSSTAAGEFECINVSIVNGAQTVSTLGKFLLDNPESTNLEEAYVSVRIIPTETISDDGETYNDQSFSKKITITNNRQNEVRQRDFIALQKVQQDIKTQLKIEKVTYYLKRQELEESAENSFTVDEATRALAYNSDIDSTFLVRTNIGQIYEDLENNRYLKLYNNSVSGIFVWNCVQITREIDKIIDSLIEEKFSQNRSEIIYSRGVIAKVVFDNINQTLELKKQHTIFNHEYLCQLGLEQQVEQIINSLLSLDVIENSKKTISNFFKSPTEVRGLYELLSKRIDISFDSNIHFDIVESEKLSTIEKKQIESYFQKFNNDEAALKVLKHIFLDLYDPSKQEFTYLSNIHFYSKKIDSTKLTDKFLLRIAYHTRLIISFEIVKFEHFTSEYLKEHSKATLISEKSNATMKFSVNTMEDAENMIDLLNNVW